MQLTALRPGLLGEKAPSHGRFTTEEIMGHEWVQPHPPWILCLLMTGGICAAEGSAREGWLRLEIEAPVSSRKQWC